MVVETENDPKYCPECGGTTINSIERGEITCSTCGLVVQEKEIDISHSGIRAYHKDEKNTRVHTGTPITSLTPHISFSTFLERKKIVNPDLRRAAKWDSYLEWENRNFLIAITEIKRIASNFNLSDHIKKSTIKLYKKVFKKNLLRGRSIHGMVTACLFYICKQNTYPITFQEILNESSVSSSILKKSYKILLNELNLKSPYVNPIALIPKYCADLGLSNETEKTIKDVLKTYIERKSLGGKDPKGICGGAIYLVAKLKNEKISQKEISQVVKITEVTLRSRYKEIFNFLQSKL